MSAPRKIIQVEERVPLSQGIPLSIQHTFAMFSASVLVPYILGISPSIALLMNGIGTLIFIFITKGKAPAYLGSSFAFISPALLVIADPSLGYQYALGGFVIVGLLMMAIAILIKFVGTKWIDCILPPAAMGPVVALIGLELAGNAASTGGVLPGDGVAIDPKAIIVFCVTLGLAVFGQILYKGFASAIAILISIIVGYVLALALGMVDFSTVGEASVLALPAFQLPKFSTKAILTIVPAILVVVNEHIGHQVVTSEVVGRDLLREPGLDKSMFSDGLSTALSGLCGSCPTTTYGENIGVMAITKVYSVWVIGGAAVFSILLSFIGKACLLIPFPFAADDHQTHNARVFSEKNAAVLCQQSVIGIRYELPTADIGKQFKLVINGKPFGCKDNAWIGHTVSVQTDGDMQFPENSIVLIKSGSADIDFCFAVML